MFEQTTFPAYFEKKHLLRESAEQTARKAAALCAAMTVPEKLSLLGGDRAGRGTIANAGYLPGVPRFGVPEIRMYDGPAGVTAMRDTTALPQPNLLGCTWDEELAYRFGSVAGRENFSVAGNCQLGTQLDTIRTPHFRRNKDMKSEDFFLNATLGAAEVRGVQDQGCIAVMKHFAAYCLDGHGGAGALIDEQTLHENYLRPFAWAVRQAGAGMLMDSYNRIGGEHCTESDYLNNQVLRGMWGFRGAVMSDWGANHSMSLAHGLDMEMPFPMFNDHSRILRALRDGSLSWAQLDAAAQHVLEAMGAAGLLSLVSLGSDGRPKEEFGRTRPIALRWSYDDEVRRGMLEEDARTALDVARAGIVLAKNERAALPLRPEDYTRTRQVALIGIGAAVPLVGLQNERAFGVLSRFRSPHRQLQSMTGGRFTAAAAFDLIGETIPEEALYLDAACTRHGVQRSYGISRQTVDLVERAPFRGPGGQGGMNELFGLIDEYGEPLGNPFEGYFGDGDYSGACAGHAVDEPAQVDRTIECLCAAPGGAPVTDYRTVPGGTAIRNAERYTWRGFLKAPETGEYLLRLHAIGGAAAFFLQIDGVWKLISRLEIRENAQWGWSGLVCTPEGMDIGTEQVHLEAGHVYPITVYGTHLDPNKDLQLRCAWVTPSARRRSYEAALDAARAADKIVLFLSSVTDAARGGLNVFSPASPSLDLPGQELQLFRDVAAIARSKGAPLITVLQSACHAIGEVLNGSDALLVTYLPGQEGAQALAEILLGTVNPSGKLCQSWPRRSEDTPVSDTPEHFRERQCNPDGPLRFTEGLFTGYRWHDRTGVAPALAFGHGLSYTSFSYEELTVTGDTEHGLTASLTVKNTGARTGDEIVQLYLGACDAPPWAQVAVRQLCGYACVRALEPGQARRVQIPVPPEMLCFWDTAQPLQERPDGTRDRWQPLHGRRTLWAAASSRDLRLSAELLL